MSEIEESLMSRETTRSGFGTLYRKSFRNGSSSWTRRFFLFTVPKFGNVHLFFFWAFKMKSVNELTCISAVIDLLLFFYKEPQNSENP